MRFKKFLYSVLLLLLVLVLIADLGLWFLVPDAQDTAFEASSLPEGMTFPGSREERKGSERPSRPSRPDRTGSDEETTSAAAAAEESTEIAAWRAWLSERVEELREYLPLSELTPVKEIVAPYRLYILIGAALGMALCIARLVCIHRKIRQQEGTEDALSVRRVALWPAFLLLLGALALVVFLFPVNEEEEPEDGAVTNTRLITGTVEKKDLTSLIQSAGYLEEQEAVTLEIPASVTVESVCVKNGDTVTAGQIVAKADKTSVMKAVAAVHEVMDVIDGQLQEAHEAKGENALTAPVGGIVKVVYAEPGDQAIDVMDKYGALMLLSLDGRMAVRIPATDDLSIGAQLTVTLPDGGELAGEVSFLEEAVATVTVPDKGYDIGTQVFVKDAAGNLLGSGLLFVNKALNITGYLGTVTRIYRREGTMVTAGATVIGLGYTSDLAEYRSLLQQRAEYEEELQALFEIYQDGYIHAPCDGVIDGLSDDLTYTSLVNMVTGVTVKQLATGPADADPADYVHYIGEVLENGGGLLSLQASSNPVQVSSYASLPALPSSTMTGTYTIPGSTPIYLLSGGWNPISVADIRAGDRILFTFDVNGRLVWVIVQHTSQPTPTPTPTPDGTHDPSSSAGPDETPDPSAGPWSGHGGHGRISFGRGGANSTPKPTYVIKKRELCAVTPLERMLITVPIDELDVLSLSLGQEADLYLDALPNTGFIATVTEIDQEGENSGGNTKYSVTLALDRGEQLYPGMNGTICFLRSEKQGVLTVPLAAVAEEGTRTLVYTAYDEETDQLLSPVEVQTGLSDGTDVEILSGLVLGDAYCYRYADAISYVTEG